MAPHLKQVNQKLETNKMKGKKKAQEPENTLIKKGEDKVKTPFMSKGIYNNYEKGMKERNQKRRSQGLAALHVRTFEEWSNV